MPKKSGALVRRAAAPAIRRNLRASRATRARPTNPGSIKAVALPAGWTTPTPKTPATAMVEHAERLSPGDRHHKPGDLWLHQQRLKGLQRFGRDLQGLEMIFDRVMTGCSEFLPGFFERFNAVNLRADVTTFINALRVLSAEELARAAVADVERRQQQHARGQVFEYIEIFYNQQRRHSSLGFLSPLAFERQWHQQHRAA